MMTPFAIPLMRNAFQEELETRRRLADFILRADRLSMGECCSKFEEAFAKVQGRRYSLLFNSGGSANLALLQALKNLGRLKDGSRIGFSALTWSTNIMPIIQLGMQPIAVDCDPETLNCMSGGLELALDKSAMDAFFVTNVLGFSGDLDRIRELCARKGILFIEDNCESLGTELPAGKTGNFGAAATFSFFVGHHMSTIEGGMICTDDEALAEMLAIVRANGWDRNLSPEAQKRVRDRHRVVNEFESKYTFYDLGFNLRPTEITGFLGLTQLDMLEKTCSVRQSNFLRLDEVVSRNPGLDRVRRDHISRISNFAFPVLVKSESDRDRYLERFFSARVEVRPLIAGNMQRQPFYGKYVIDREELPGADALHRRGFYFGNYPELTEAELEVIAECLRPL